MYFDWPTKENDTRRIGEVQESRSCRVASEIQSEKIDTWLQQSVSLVAGRVRGLAENQRRIRYFGFETTHEQDKK